MNTTTTQNVHGHEILSLLAQSPMTRPQLEAQVAARYGADPRFYTCSAQDLTIDGLLQFLLAKGKIQNQNGTLATDPSRICNH